MAHKPVASAPITPFESGTNGQANLWLEDVPELERMTAQQFIDWYLAKMEVQEPHFVEWYRLRCADADDL
jgi:hypothetical protein